MSERHVSEASVQTEKNGVDCGIQWSEHEFNFAGERWKVEHDHPWVSSHAAMQKSHDPLVENAGTDMLEDSLPLQAPQPQQTSTPLKPLARMTEEAGDDPEPLSDSYKCDDPDYEPPGGSEDSSDNSDHLHAPDETSQYVHGRKFIIFEENLDQLLWNLRCQEPGCTAPVINVHKNQPVGMLLHVEVTCLNGHIAYQWESMPRVGDMPAGHLIGSAALMFSGNQYSSISALVKFMNVSFIGKSSYYSVQKTFLVPVVMSYWQQEQEALIEDMLARVDRGKEIKIAGDGQCDSPGFSAKYCTYSLMDQQNGKIVNFNVKQVTECTSSVAMETEAFVECVRFMAEQGIYIDVFSSDRHHGVSAVIKGELREVIGDHQFDIFHITKSFQKDSARKAKGKDCQSLKDWAQALNLHLWRACATCDGNAEILIEKFKASIFHASGRHKFPHFRHFQRCAHPIPLPPDQPRMYMEEGSAAHEALGKAVNNRTLLTDLKKCIKFCHTGQLESYHSLHLKYCPKRSHFAMDVMEARGALAALDHNFNVGREQAVVKQPSAASGPAGTPRFTPYCSKRTKRWSAWPVLQGKQYDYVYDMITRVVDKKASGDATLYASREVAKNISRTPYPGKASLVAHHIHRMDVA